jgi:hypothetical protein
LLANDAFATFERARFAFDSGGFAFAVFADRGDR